MLNDLPRRPRRQRPLVWRQSGHKQARRWFALTTCAECEVVPATERHHWDGNAANNAPTNVVALCRRCHMRIDGRLETFREQARTRDKIQPAKPCSRCGRLYKPLRRGMCSRCYDRQR